MIRIPRPTLTGAVLVIGLAAALAAPGAIGRSQAKPVNTKEPFIASPYLVQVGTTISGNKGNWDGATSFSYQWLRCNTDALNCKQGHERDRHGLPDREGGRRPHAPLRGDGQELRRIAPRPCRTAHRRSRAPPMSPSRRLSRRSRATLSSVRSSPPTRGTWQGTQPISYEYSWQTCNAADTTCTNTGAKGTVYTVANADVGQHVRVRVTAKNSAGQSNAFSAPTAAVKGSGGGGGGGTGNAIPVADVGPAGERLIVDQVDLQPEPGHVAEPADHREDPVKDTKGHLVQGALVFIQSTPVVASIPTDAPTGDDGTVTYSIQPAGRTSR